MDVSYLNIASRLFARLLTDARNPTPAVGLHVLRKRVDDICSLMRKFQDSTLRVPEPAHDTVLARAVSAAEDCARPDGVPAQAGTDARVRAAAAVSHAAAPYSALAASRTGDGFVPVRSTAQLLSYAVVDVFQQLVLGWRVLGRGEFGEAIVGCLRKPGTGVAAASAGHFAESVSAYEDDEDDMTDGGDSAAILHMTCAGKGALCHAGPLFATKVAWLEIEDAALLRAGLPMTRAALFQADSALREVAASFEGSRLVACHATPHLAINLAAMFVTRAPAVGWRNGVNVVDASTRKAPRDAAAAGPEMGTAPLGTPLQRTTPPAGEARRHESPISTLGIVTLMERCDATLFSWCQRVAVDVRVLRSVLFQVMQVLVCLRAAFDMKHNDLHDGNVMLSFVAPDTTWVYVLPDGSVAQVPSYGLCVQLIDLGLATSTVLFGDHDHDHSHRRKPDITRLLEALGHNVDNSLVRQVTDDIGVAGQDLGALAAAWGFRASSSQAVVAAARARGNDVYDMRNLAHRVLDAPSTAPPGSLGDVLLRVVHATA
jgi:hypothetical protein